MLVTVYHVWGPMTTKSEMYQAYLLRCWREEQAAPDGSSRWRFSVEEVLHERRRWGFSSLESLFTFFQAELRGAEADERGGTMSRSA
jgi:hypothetical protein